MRSDRAADVAYFACVLGGIAFLVLFGAFAQRSALVHSNDFSGIWSGGRAIALGSDPYDRTSFPALAERLGTQLPDSGVYGYPAWVALAMVPLAWLPLEVASWSWTIATSLLALVATRAALRAFLPRSPLAHALTGLAATISTPAYHQFVLGQWGFALLAALFAGTIAIRNGHALRGAAALLTLLAKPQLFLAAPIALLATRRVALYWFAGAAAIALLSTLAMPWWWSAWLSAVPAGRLAQPATLYSLLRDLLGGAGIAVAVALAAVAILSVLPLPRGSDAWRAGWLSLSLAFAPYEWAYDHYLLLAPLVIAAAAVTKRSERAAIVVLGVGTGVLLFLSPVLYAVAIARSRETFSAIAPVLIFALIVGALWWARPAGDRAEVSAA